MDENNNQNNLQNNFGCSIYAWNYTMLALFVFGGIIGPIAFGINIAQFFEYINKDFGIALCVISIIGGCITTISIGCIWELFIKHTSNTQKRLDELNQSIDLMSKNISLTVELYQKACLSDNVPNDNLSKKRIIPEKDNVNNKTQPKTWYCTQCGMHNHASSLYCIRCGQIGKLS